MLLIPFPEKEQAFKYQITLIIALFMIILHFFINIFSLPLPPFSLKKSESRIYFSVQSKLYKNYIQSLGSYKNSDQRFIASIFEKKIIDSKNQQAHLSRASIYDPLFNPLEVSKKGVDLVEYDLWKDIHWKMKQNIHLSSSALLGVNYKNHQKSYWLSYLFVHTGWVHLLSNIIFLILFGILIETLFGGIMVLLILLGSGALAAPFHILLSGLSPIPLVGSSGGVCGLIAFYCIYKFSHKMRFFYWILPFKNYYGFISLPLGIIFVLWTLADIAGYLSGISFLQHVAHTAHMGGFFIGALCALGLLVKERVAKWPYFTLLKDYRNLH